VTTTGPRLPSAYPSTLVEQAELTDGTRVCFRPIRPDDAVRLERLLHRLSPLTRHRRFFTPVPRPDPDVIDRLVHVDYADRLAVVAEVDNEVIGVARYDRTTPDEAEVAVVVEDAWHGRGVGTRLLWRLSAAARQRGVQAFVAEVQGSNRPMMGLLRVLSDDVRWELSDGAYHVLIGLHGAPDPVEE
jgi:GNAT superfamily N-acetyltransferase